MRKHGVLAASAQITPELRSLAAVQGLIPRATELIKLGAAFTLAYGPFIAGVGLAFWAVYAVSGNYGATTGGRGGTVSGAGAGTREAVLAALSHCCAPKLPA